MRVSTGESLMPSVLWRRLRRPIATSPWPAVVTPRPDGAQPTFDAGRCDLNGACAQACPVGAIRVSAAFELDRARCISCSRCIEVCPTQALAPGITFSPPSRSRAELLVPSVEHAAADLAERARRVLGRSLHVR